MGFFGELFGGANRENVQNDSKVVESEQLANAYPSKVEEFNQLPSHDQFEKVTGKSIVNNELPKEMLPQAKEDLQAIVRYLEEMPKYN